MVSIPNGIILNNRGQVNSTVTMESSGNIIGAGIYNSSLNKRNWMIYFYYTRKDFYECKVVIQDELKFSNGYNEFANYMLGIIVRDEGRIQDSLNYFKKCNSLNPKNAENLRQIGRSFSENQNIRN